MTVPWHFSSASRFTFRFTSCFSHPPHRLRPRHPIRRSVPPLAYSLLWSAALVSLSQYGCPDSRGRWRRGLNTGGRKSQRRVWQSHLDSHGEVWHANHNNEVWSRGGSRGGWESQEEKAVNTDLTVLNMRARLYLRACETHMLLRFASLSRSTHGSVVGNSTPWKMKPGVGSVQFTFVFHRV